MATALNANINELANHLRKMEDKLEQLGQNQEQNEFEVYLESGLLHLYILRVIAEDRGWTFNANSASHKIRKGNEVELTKNNEKLKLNVEFSTNGRFEIRCNDAGKPTQNEVDYFVFMDLKFAILVKPDQVVVDNPDIKQGDGYKFYYLNPKQKQVKASQIIQYSDIVL